MAKFAVIIAAAGDGRRFKGNEKKPFAKLDGRALFLRAVEMFINRDDVCQTILAISPEDMEFVREKYGANLGFMGVELVEGGENRLLSVQKALAAVKEEAEYVAIHDAARVCTTAKTIDSVFEEATKSGSAILAAPLSGTIKRVTADHVIDETVVREGLYEAQTPQVFKKDILSTAYENLAEDSQATDDAEVVAAAGHEVTVVESDQSNIKITSPGDMPLAAAIIKSRPKPKPTAPRGPFEEAQW